MTAPREIRVFVASPDDVMFERERVERVVIQLNSDYAAMARFRAIRWEQTFYKAHKTFQAQIPEAVECDIVLVIFGNKLGSPLPKEFENRLPDGTSYPSGTAYELLSSVAGAEQNNKPDVFVFRKTTEPQFGASQQKEFAAATREKQRLDTFFHEWFRTPDGGFRRSLHHFADPDEFEEQVDVLLRQWSSEALNLAPLWDVNRDGSPFPGLRPFDARHSQVFFGRDRKVRRAIDELLRAPGREPRRSFLLVVGPSGSGKSSLVRAGVIPRLTRPSMVHDIDLWRVAVMRPGGAKTVFAAFAEALYVKGESDDDTGGFGPALPELADGPFKSAKQLAELLEAVGQSAVAPIVMALDTVGDVTKEKGGFTRPVRAALLLLVDQLEEVFANSVTDAQRALFAKLLTFLADSSRVWIIATLRADLYPQMLDHHSPFLALKDSGGTYDLASPGDSEVREILEKSATAAGLSYEKDAETRETLDDVLLRDASGVDTLPLLQFALERLYDQREVRQTEQGQQTFLTFAAYHKLRGLDGAIDEVAEAAIAEPDNRLGPNEIDRALPRLLRRLAEPVRGDRVTTSASAALTVRAVPLMEAAPDESARRLVDVLVRARLLVSASASGGQALLRLAHERVLTSWQRARLIVQQHLEFFEIKADIETEMRRWISGGRRRELLLSGMPLAKAEATVRGYADELPTELLHYVVASGRRSRLRQRLVAGAATIFFFVAVIATSFGLLAYSAEQKATRSYAAAKDAADNLVSAIPKELRTQKDISTQTLDTVFEVAAKLIQSIQDVVEQRDGYVTRQLQAGFAAIQTVLLNVPYTGDGAMALDRSRADMLYEFAETYHQSANNLAKAKEKAVESLALRQFLYDRGDQSSEMRGSIAASQMELADLMRAEIEHATAPDFAEVRGLLEQARQTLEGLLQRLPDNPNWGIAYSRVMTRLGDLEMKADHPNLAAADYAQAKTTGMRLFRARQNDADALHEVAWSYRKLGEQQSRLGEVSAANRTYTDEVCIRRHLVELHPFDPLMSRDLAWALAGLGDVQKEAHKLASARDAYFEALHRWLALADADHSQRRLFFEVSVGLRKVGTLPPGNDEVDEIKAFANAANDVQGQLDRAFPVEAKLPHDPIELRSVLQQASALKQAGVRAMIEPGRRSIVENAEQAFATTTLAGSQHAMEACWDTLIRSVTATAVQ
jgi:hypothetical protein